MTGLTLLSFVLPLVAKYGVPPLENARAHFEQTQSLLSIAKYGTEPLTYVHTHFVQTTPTPMIAKHGTPPLENAHAHYEQSHSLFSIDIYGTDPFTNVHADFVQTQPTPLLAKNDTHPLVNARAHFEQTNSLHSNAKNGTPPLTNVHAHSEQQQPLTFIAKYGTHPLEDTHTHYMPTTRSTRQKLPSEHKPLSTIPPPSKPYDAIPSMRTTLILTQLLSSYSAQLIALAIVTAAIYALNSDLKRCPRQFCSRRRSRRSTVTTAIWMATALHTIDNALIHLHNTVTATFKPQKTRKLSSNPTPTTRVTRILLWPISQTKIDYMSHTIATCFATTHLTPQLILLSSYVAFTVAATFAFALLLHFCIYHDIMLTTLTWQIITSSRCARCLSNGTSSHRVEKNLLRRGTHKRFWSRCRRRLFSSNIQRSTLSLWNQAMDILTRRYHNSHVILYLALLTGTIYTPWWMFKNTCTSFLAWMMPHIWGQPQATIVTCTYTLQLIDCIWHLSTQKGNNNNNKSDNKPQTETDQAIGGSAPSTKETATSEAHTTRESETGFYKDRQEQNFCQIHALNALFGRKVLHGPRAMQLACDITIQEPTRGWGFHFRHHCTDGTEGNFSTSLINRILREITMPMAFLHRTSNNTIHRGTNKATILSMIPPGHDRFILQWNGGNATDEGNFGHSVCIRKRETNDTWYLLDSLHREKPLRDNDWADLYGMTYILASGDAWDFRESLQSVAGERTNDRTQPQMRASQATLLHPADVQLRELQATPGELKAAADHKRATESDDTRNLKAAAAAIAAAHRKSADLLKAAAESRATTELRKRIKNAKKKNSAKIKKNNITAIKAKLAQDALKLLMGARNPNTRPPQHTQSPPCLQGNKIQAKNIRTTIEQIPKPTTWTPDDTQSNNSTDHLLEAITTSSSLLGNLTKRGMQENNAPLPSNNSWYEINRLANMYFPPKDPLLQQWNITSRSPDTALKFITENQHFMTSLHQHTSSRYSQGADTAPPMTCNTNDSLSFITWNVRGIHSKAQILSEVSKRHEPLALVLTETKLLPHQHSTARVRAYLPGYTLIASCHPQPPALVKRRKHPNLDGSTRKQVTGKAGVIIAIRSEWARPHYLHRFETPQNLLGYLVHIRISLPDSIPLHIIAVYRANTQDWEPKHQHLTKYLTTALNQITSKEEQVLLGGDWNGVLKTTDRSSGKTSPLDSTLQTAFANLNLCSAFNDLPGRPHSYCAPHLNNTQPTTSRIDDWT